MSALTTLMKELLTNPKTARFSESLQHSDLPANWANDPEIIDLAAQAYKNLDRESPFFRAYYGNTPWDNVWYSGQGNTNKTVFDPQRSPSKAIAGFATADPGVAAYYRYRAGKLAPVNYQAGALSTNALGEVTYDPTYYAYKPAHSYDPVYGTNTMQRILADIDYIQQEGLPLYTYGYYGRQLLAPDDLNYTLREFRRNVPRDIIDTGRFGDEYENFVYFNRDAFDAVDPTLIRDISHDAFEREIPGKVYPLYVKSEKPVFMDGDGNSWKDYDVSTFIGAGDNVDKQTLLQNAAPSGDIRAYDLVDMSNTGKLAPTDYFAADLFNRNLADAIHTANIADGYNTPSNTIAIRNPEQIKSVYNRGTFNPNDPNIYRGVIAAPLIVDPPLEESWNPIESIAAAPIGAASAAGAAGNLLLDAILSTVPVGKFFNSGMTDNRQLMFGE